VCELKRQRGSIKTEGGKKVGARKIYTVEHGGLKKQHKERRERKRDRVEKEGGRNLEKKVG